MAKENYIRPIDIKHGIIDMTHGAGGRATAQLIDEVFAKAFRNTYLAQAHDGAVMPALKGEPVMSCDAHVVHPLFFAGGDIGRLAVCGTVNDVAMLGARPRYLSCACIIEEGLELSILDRVVADMADYVVVMYAGRVIESGTAEDIFHHPCHPYTIGLMNSKPVVGKKVDKLYNIPGSVPNPVNMPDYCYFRDRCELTCDHCRGE